MVTRPTFWLKEVFGRTPKMAAREEPIAIAGNTAGKLLVCRLSSKSALHNTGDITHSLYCGYNEHDQDRKRSHGHQRPVLPA